MLNVIFIDADAAVNEEDVLIEFLELLLLELVTDFAAIVEFEDVAAVLHGLSSTSPLFLRTSHAIQWI